MLSFAGGVKAELCQERLRKSCCTRAELYGVLLFCNLFTPTHIRITTQCVPFAQRLPRLLRKAFSLSFDVQPEDVNAGGKLKFELTDPTKIAVIMDAYGYARENSLSHHINLAVLEEDCCRAAFLRGAFLAGGSVTDPEKRYHLELVTNHLYVQRELMALLQELGFAPKGITRSANFVTYLKRSEAIADLLTTIGAPLAAMEIMNAKVEKHLRNGVNRWSNCDVANVDKAVDAAQSQIEAIRRIQETVGLDALPDKLRETALFRLENPELSLSQLAQLAQVSKSCMNHRLRKLMEMARPEEEAT
ncbi:MAG: DNA-binding protein WhiA [Oscillospiraceae bacterium]|nr:DNA-binding protein WhiA [Oscillospiraceae bacterium]